MDNRQAIAIIGMACRFPGAPDVDTFWNNLCGGVESLRRFTDQELAAAGVAENMRRDPSYVPVNGALDGIDMFDAAFFGVTPRDAEIMDPQHRLFLECAWEALEAGGYRPGRADGRIGVYAGSGVSTYLINNLLPRADVLARVGDLELLMANNKDFVPSRVAYKLDLNGPAVNANTACSTGLVNVHLACQALLNFECDMALAGGVSVQVPQDRGYLYQPDGIVSPDGHCRAFDANAAGTVSGNGAGVVLLKRLEEAIADGDHIDAVIVGTAINNDGAAKAGFTAPSVSGQADAIAQALATADVSADSIGYIETHGTGTPVGDPIEIAALTEAFRARTQRTGFCAIGSVKTNFGHLDEAAGVAGLIKTALALRHATLPPSLHCATPGPQLRLETTPFRVNTALAPWPQGAEPRRAGVSSFGLGGTNAHAILEQAPQKRRRTSASRHVLALSARSRPALDAMTARLADTIAGSPDLDLGDVAHTLLAGRRNFSHRAVFSILDRDDAVRVLRGGAADRSAFAVAPDERRDVVFMFPGHGAAAAGMARSIYDREPVYREVVDRCAALLRPRLGVDLRDAIFESGDQLARMSIAQPAMFVVEYALARLWMSWGVEPAAMIGHSAGEYVAACLAGVFTLEDGLTIIAERGALIEQAPPGSMLAVTLDESVLRRRLPAGLDVAVVTGPGLCVVAGPTTLIDQFRETVERDGVECRRVDLKVAAHSSLLNDAADELRSRLAAVPLSAPRMRIASNVTGTWLTAAEATSPDYWARHLRDTVRFGDGIEMICRTLDQPAFLEVGPGRSLTSPVLRHPARAAADPVIPSMRHRSDQADDHAILKLALGKLWANGVDLDTAKLFADGERNRVPLPTYPFERKRFWIDAVPANVGPSRRSSVKDWLYLPSWRRGLPAPVHVSDRPTTIAVLGAGIPAADRCIVQLRSRGHHVVPSMTTLTDVDAIFDFRLCAAIADTAADSSFAEFLSTARTIAAVEREIELTIFTSNAMQVTDEEVIEPAKTAVFGIIQSLEQEYPNIRCRAIDIGAAPTAAVIDGFIDEALSRSTDRFVALRGSQRWCRDYVSIQSPPASVLRERGVYVITGGIGDVGASIARALARQVRGRLVLITRSRTLDSRLRGELEELGAEIQVHHADVADEAAMRRILDDTVRSFGAINGVIHAAGVTTADILFKPIVESDAEQVRALFRPKVAGTLVLERLLTELPIDFCLLISSNASTLGGLGLATYGAASHVLDAIAARCRQSGKPWSSSNWDGWPSAAATPAQRQSGIEVFTMSAAEAEEAFLRVLACPTERIVVSAGDLHARLDRSAARDTAPIDTPLATALPVDKHVTETEGAVLSAVTELLGVAPSTIRDNFFELGGDSLLGSRMMARLSKQLSVPLSVRLIFADPTLHGIAAQIDTARAGRGSVAGSIPRIPDAASYALSSTQRRLWILHEIDRGSAAYHVPLHQRLDGPLDYTALQTAINAVISRHESLRTTFDVIDGEPRQIVHPAMTLVLDAHDVSAATDPEAEARALARSHSNEPFDLVRGPLLRTAVVRIAHDRHVLLFTMHHIVSDGVTITVIARDLARAYSAALRGTIPQLPPLAIQYRDFAAWQNERLDGDSGQSDRDYWHRRLGGELPVLDLIEDFARPGVLGTNGRELIVPLSVSVTAALTALAQRHNASLFMVLIAALKTYLYRCSGQRDIIIGTPSAGRSHADLDEQVGCFLNTLVLRDEVDPAQSFASLIDQVRVTATEAFEHQEYPFERLVSELQLPRDASRSPLFDVMMILQNDIGEALPMEGLSAQWFAEHNGSARLDLSFNFKRAGDALVLGLEYNSDLYLPERAAAMAAQFQALLEAVAAAPDVPLDQPSMMSPSQTELIVRTFNDTAAGRRTASSVIELFEQRAAATPDAAAVRHGDDVTSYRDLDLRSSQVARYIHERSGIEPGHIAIVAVDSGAALPVALIALMKLRSAVILIEPSITTARLQQLVRDSGCRTVISSASFGNGAGCPAIDLSRDRQHIDAHSEQPITAGDRSLDDDVLVFFTSGSTGIPKGVRLNNRGLINELDWFARYFRMTASDVIPQKTVLTFVDCIAELLVPLAITGGAIDLRPDYAITADLARLGEWCRTCGATMLQFVPEVFEELAAEIDVATLDRMRALILSGAAVTRQVTYPFAVFNLYGCSETTALATACDMTKPTRLARVPIGAPLQNTTAYVLDAAMRPCPLFVPGEIFVGGDAVSAGYLGQPGMTAERFVASPFKQGDTLFRTGDFGRWYPDGTLDYLGRRDDQAKIRGQRIECGAVEQALCRHAQIQDASVIVRTVGNAATLVAYVVTTEAALDRDTLRAHLSAIVPDYMIPAIYMPIAALPRTSSGKIDRKALPDPQPALRTTTMTPPRTPLEQAIASIWREVLDLDVIGVDDDFLSLGGHSLKATRVASRIARDLGLNVSVTDVFRHPTIAALAEAAQRRPSTAAGSLRTLTDADAIAPLTAAERELLG
jgi:iturin family lipopeptide synthetase A